MGGKGRMRSGRERETAQTMAEFALALPVLLLLALGIVEFGRLLQAWLTVQNSAQAGARYAVTGQGYADPLVDPWDEDRLQAIKDEARGAAGSLGIDDSAGPVQPGYFNVTVLASDPPTTTAGVEFAGGPQARVGVDVTYNHGLITPVVQQIVPWIRLRAHSEMINERYRHPGYGTPAGELPPTILPTPVRYYIAGYVGTSEGAAIANVAMNGLPGSPVTGDDGHYWAQVDDGRSGVAVPALASYSFDPITRTYSSVASDLLEEHYIGTPD